MNVTHPFKQIFQSKIKARTITKYRSTVTGLTVSHIDTAGPIVKGFFALATEEDSHDGLPHTLEHLIFLGSELFPYKGVLDLAANHCLAQGTNAWTAIDHTCYTVETAGSEGFLILLPIYLDHILFPTLSDQAFQTEVHHINGTGDDAGVVYCEMQARENNAESREEHALQEAVFRNNCGYKWETGGIMANLRTTCSNERVRAYHKKFYRPENLDIVICGQIDIEKVFEVIMSVDERIAKINYGPYEKPWTGKVELFNSYISKDVEFPAKDEDNGRVSMTWKGPSLNDLKSLEAHSILWNYMIKTSVAPLIKTLVDIPEPYCSSISYSTEEYPTTLMTVIFKGVKAGTHVTVRDIAIKTMKDTCKGDIDMNRLKNQIKNSICNFSDKLENDPSELLAELVILDELYGGDNNYQITTFTKIFDILRDLKEQKQSFWKEIISYYIEEPSVTINGIPSVQFMNDIDVKEKARIKEQQDHLGAKGMADCENEINKCIDFNEKNLDEVEDVIEKLAAPKIGEGISFHPLNTEKEIAEGIFIHEIESEFIRFYFTFDTENFSIDEKALLGVYATLFCDTELLHGGQKISYEDAILLKEELLLDARCSVTGVEGESFAELVTMLFKFMVEDVDKCQEFIKNIIGSKVFTADRVTTAVNKLSSKIAVSLRKANVVLSQLDTVMKYHGSCKSSRNLFSELKMLEKYKKDIPSLVAKLESLQKLLFNENKIVLHIITSKANVIKHFCENNLSNLQKVYNLSKANVPSLLPAHFRRKESEQQNVINIVPTDESSYLKLSLSLDVSYVHPDYLAVLLFAEYLGQCEGPLWKQIRGQGFAYTYSLYNGSASGYMSFYLGKATNVSKGYMTAKETVDGIINEDDLDETQIETAKGALAYSFIQKYETPASSAFASIINIHRGLPIEHDRDLLMKIECIGMSEMLTTCKKYFQPLFSGAASSVVCCPSNKKDEILKDMSAIGVNFAEIENIDSFVDSLSC